MRTLFLMMFCTAICLGQSKLDSTLTVEKQIIEIRIIQLKADIHDREEAIKVLLVRRETIEQILAEEKRQRQEGNRKSNKK